MVIYKYPFLVNSILALIVKNGKEVARLISKDKTVSYLSDSLLGILKNDILEKDITKERVLKHEGLD